MADRIKTAVIGLHHGPLGFDVSHDLFARAILDGENINRREAEAGFDNLVLTLAAQQSIQTGGVVTRRDLIASFHAKE